jgi:hypothetical protein
MPVLDCRGVEITTAKSSQQAALSIQPAYSFVCQKSFLGMDRGEVAEC